MHYCRIEFNVVAMGKTKKLKFNKISEVMPHCSYLPVIANLMFFIRYGNPEKQ
jgi:hypothetical protein